MCNTPYAMASEEALDMVRARLKKADRSSFRMSMTMPFAWSA